MGTLLLDDATDLRFVRAFPFALAAVGAVATPALDRRNRRAVTTAPGRTRVDHS